MKTYAKIKDLENEVEISSSMLSGGYKVMYNGYEATKTAKGRYSIKSESGNEIFITIKKKLWGIDVPEVICNGYVVNDIRPLNTLEKIVILYPILFLFFGALGGATAAFTIMMTISITRADDNVAKSLFLNIMVNSVMTGILYYVAFAIGSSLGI